MSLPGPSLNSLSVMAPGARVAPSRTDIPPTVSGEFSFRGALATSAGAQADPPIPHRLATVMVVNLLIPVTVLALFKGFGDYNAAYDQTYGKLERWTVTLADIWEPVLSDAVGLRERTGLSRRGEPLDPQAGPPGSGRARLTREVHRLALERQKDVPNVRYAALLDAQGAVLLAVGEWAPERMETALQQLANSVGGFDDASNTGDFDGTLSNLTKLDTGPERPVGLHLVLPDRQEEFIAVRSIEVWPRSDSVTAGQGAAVPLVVLAAFDSTAVRRHFRLRLLRLFALDAGLAVLVGILGWRLVVRFVIRPVRELRAGVAAIAAGRLDHRLPADSPDELGLLASGFNEMAERLADGYRELDGRNQRLRADRAYAGRLHQRLLPARLPRPPGFAFAAVYQPCEDLGGDFYDVFELDRGRVAFYLADVSGHGIGAALITVFIRETFARLRDSGEQDRARLSEPARTLAAIRDRFSEEDFGTLFVSMVYGVLDSGASLVRFASAGHPMPLLSVDGLVREAADPDTGGGPIIGGFMPPDLPFPEHQLDLPPGSRLLLYTDGVLDVTGPDDRPFGMARLRRLLLESDDPSWPTGTTLHTGTLSRSDGPEDSITGGTGEDWPTGSDPSVWVARAVDAIRRHVGPQAYTDDVSMLLLAARPRKVPSSAATGAAATLRSALPSL